MKNEERLMSGLKAVGLGVLGVLALIALTYGGFALKVALSDVMGQGQAIVNKNDAVNRTLSQERFEELYQEAMKADANIATMREAVELSPDSNVAATNLTGAITYCRGVVADYNAEARKYSSADFRAVDLPASLDSETLCSR